MQFADNSIGAYDPIGHLVATALPEGQYSPGWQISEHIASSPVLELKYPAAQFSGEDMNTEGQYVPGGHTIGFEPSPIGQ